MIQTLIYQASLQLASIKAELDLVGAFSLRALWVHMRAVHELAVALVCEGCSQPGFAESRYGCGGALVLKSSQLRPKTREKWKALTSMKAE